MKERPTAAKRPVRRLSTLEALNARPDRRNHLRTLRQERLFVQLGIDAATGERRTLKCDSADLSRGGLRVGLSEALPPGAALEVWIRLVSARRNFYLCGEVRWCVRKSPGFEIGVHVREAPATDYRMWRRLRFA